LRLGKQNKKRGRKKGGEKIENPGRGHVDCTMAPIDRWKKSGEGKGWPWLIANGPK